LQKGTKKTHLIDLDLRLLIRKRVWASQLVLFKKRPCSNPLFPADAPPLEPVSHRSMIPMSLQRHWNSASVRYRLVRETPSEMRLEGVQELAHAARTRGFAIKQEGK